MNPAGMYLLKIIKETFKQYEKKVKFPKYEIFS